MKFKHFLLSLMAFFFAAQAMAQCPATFTYTLQPNGTAVFTSTGSNSIFTNYFWSFGNGASGTGSTASTVYNASGTYIVCLYVVDTVSNCSDSTCVPITVTNSTSSCSAAFGYGVQNNTLYLYSTGSNNSAATYNWYVNGSMISTLMAPTYTFTTGTYNVCLVVTDAANNCVDSVCQTLNLTAGGTGCQAQYTYTVGANGLVAFSANTSLNSSATTYQWVINNSVYGGSNLTYTFPQNGTYLVCLVVSDSMNNCMDSTCNYVTVNSAGSGCSAAFTYICNPSSVSLTASSVFSASTTYTWLVNGNVVGNGQTYNYPASSGTYTICLAVEDTLTNCTDTTCQIITVGTNVCQANFYIYPDSAGPPHTYIGINISSGSNLTYTWTWGDGSSSTGAYPSHTYASAGNYVICLFITNNATNCADSMCMNAGILKGTAMYTINFQAPTAVSNITKETLSIYPNPAKEAIRIQGSNAKSLQVDILSLNGSILKSTHSTGNEDIQISSLAKGIYTIRVKEDNGSSHYLRFIKE